MVDVLQKVDLLWSHCFIHKDGLPMDHFAGNRKKILQSKRSAHVQRCAPHWTPKMCRRQSPPLWSWICLCKNRIALPHWWDWTLAGTLELWRIPLILCLYQLVACVRHNIGKISCTWRERRCERVKENPEIKVRKGKWNKQYPCKMGGSRALGGQEDSCVPL